LNVELPSPTFDSVLLAPNDMSEYSTRRTFENKQNIIDGRRGSASEIVWCWQCPWVGRSRSIVRYLARMSPARDTSRSVEHP
jgi:hypothetical protein